MGRVARVMAMLISTQLLQGPGPATAGESDSRDGFPDEMRGMVVLRLPFSGASIFSAPRVGFDFRMGNHSDLADLEVKYDPQTGRRLPEIDASSMRTWPIDLPEFDLPDAAPGEPQPNPDKSQGRPPSLG